LASSSEYDNESSSSIKKNNFMTIWVISGFSIKTRLYGTG
jgi:hypothetical protein